jgi:hypothetical protein
MTGGIADVPVLLVSTGTNPDLAERIETGTIADELLHRPRISTVTYLAKKLHLLV